MFHIAPFKSAVNNDVFDSLFKGFEMPLSVSSEPYTEEGEDGISISLDMPGFEKSRILISREQNVVTISAEREIKTKGGTDTRKFIRRFSLPQSVDLEQIDAEYKNGVLTISAKKHEKAKPKMIEVK